MENIDNNLSNQKFNSKNKTYRQIINKLIIGISYKSVGNIQNGLEHLLRGYAKLQNFPNNKEMALRYVFLVKIADFFFLLHNYKMAKEKSAEVFNNVELVTDIDSDKLQNLKQKADLLCSDSTQMCEGKQ